MPAEAGQGAPSAGPADLIGRRMSLGWLPAGLHTWRAADGAVLFHRLRFVRPPRRDPGAELNACIEPLHFDGRAWRAGEPAPPRAGRPLFLLPELLAADPAVPVHLVPDETLAAVLFALGLPATTGAGAPASESDWSTLLGRRLRLWPAQGRTASRAQRNLLVHLRRLGHLVEELDCAAIAAPTGADLPQAFAATVAALPWRGPGSANAPDLHTVRAGELESESLRWLWPGRIALGKLTLLSGDPGLGKSILTIELAARVSRGASWPVDGAACPGGEVLLVCDEDGAADTIRPRLEAAGADLSRVHILRSVAPGQGGRGLNLHQDLAGLAAFLAAHPQVRLVCVDPLTAYMGETDSHRNAVVRTVLQPLGNLAARAGVAIVAVSHLAKAGYGGSSLYRVSGSLAFVAAARASYLVARDPADPERRLLLPSKNNLGQDISGLAYRIVPGANGAPRVEWGDAPVALNADQALAAQRDQRTEQNEAAAWLRDLLGEGGLPAAQVRQSAVRAGLAWRTLHRARRAAGVVSTRQGFGTKATYIWSLDTP